MNRLARGALVGGTDQGVATVYQKHRCMRRRKQLYMHCRLPGAGRLRGYVNPFGDEAVNSSHGKRRW